jgi:hypothetical protein
MESGSKQLDWIHVLSSPVLRELQGIGYVAILTRSLGCLVNPLALSSACWEGVSTEHRGGAFCVIVCGKSSPHPR